MNFGWLKKTNDTNENVKKIPYSFKIYSQFQKVFFGPLIVAFSNITVCEVTVRSIS